MSTKGRHRRLVVLVFHYQVICSCTQSSLQHGHLRIPNPLWSAIVCMNVRSSRISYRTQLSCVSVELFGTLTLSCSCINHHRNLQPRARSRNVLNLVDCGGKKFIICFVVFLYLRAGKSTMHLDELLQTAISLHPLSSHLSTM